MHGDNRNYHYRQNDNNTARRANSTPQKNNADSNKRVQQNIRPQVQIQPRRTVNPAVPGSTVQNSRPVQGGRSAARATYSVQQNTRVRQQTARNTAQQPSNIKAPSAVSRQAPAPRSVKKPSKFVQMHSWLKKNYTVNKKAIAQRELITHDLVREKGSIDYIFFVLVLILLAFGTVMVYSASYAYSKTTYGDSYYIILRQIVFALGGLAGMAFIIRFFPPERIRKWSVGLFVAFFLILMIIPLPIPGITVVHGGARRWLNLGFIEIQPSEFMKLTLAMMLAWYFDRFYERVVPPAKKFERYKYGVITPLFITGLVCVLVLIEKHLSGTIIMALIGVILIFASGAPIFWLVPGIGAGGAILGLLIAVLPHAQRRVGIWLHPETDPLGAGYQTLQGLYAIGSGGFFGMGLGNSYQKHMYVSQPQNDFIFTIVCEELGFVGAVAVILLFTLLIWRGIVIAMNAPDIYSKLLVVGIIGKIAIQSILNIAVVTNSIPNTGISLPFFSYGGSSLLVLLAEMGIILSISRFSKQRK